MIVIIPAAGIGSRFDDPVPKQYHPLADQPILQRTIERLLACSSVSAIMVAIAGNDQWFAQLPSAGRVMTCKGGSSRAESVHLAMQALEERGAIEPSILIAVHDAVRPLFARTLVDKLAQVASWHEGGAIAAIPVTDTVKQVTAILTDHRDGLPIIGTTIPRTHLWLAQTPQVFPARILKRALSLAQQTNAFAAITDDASAVECFTDYRPALVLGDKLNLKITTPEDLQLAHYYWSILSTQN